jgi:hypothetical protein
MANILEGPILILEIGQLAFFKMNFNVISPLLPQDGPDPVAQ